MEFDPKDFKRKFPHLYEELGQTEEPDSPRLGNQNPSAGSLNPYSPEVISYLRRARTNEEATEIIAYLRKRGEISQKDADSITKQIEQNGVRSFGALRTWGDFEREFRRKNSQSRDREEEQKEQ